jgi:hypothetical protein
LAASRVAGAWWLAGDGGLPSDGEYALVVLAEPPVAGSAAMPAEDVLAAMLDAALAENPPERLVILAPNRARLGRLTAKLAAAAARGARVIAGGVDPWGAMDGAAQVYSAGGETGFPLLCWRAPHRRLRPSRSTPAGA